MTRFIYRINLKRGLHYWEEAHGFWILGNWGLPLEKENRVSTNYSWRNREASWEGNVKSWRRKKRQKVFFFRTKNLSIYCVPVMPYCQLFYMFLTFQPPYEYLCELIWLLTHIVDIILYMINDSSFMSYFPFWYFIWIHFEGVIMITFLQAWLLFIHFEVHFVYYGTCDMICSWANLCCFMKALSLLIRYVFFFSYLFVFIDMYAMCNYSLDMFSFYYHSCLVYLLRFLVSMIDWPIVIIILT